MELDNGLMNIKIVFGSGKSSRRIRKKGQSLVEIPTNYCVLDLETTGLNPYYDDIIEIGILKVRNDKVVEKYQSLIKPAHKYAYIDDNGDKHYEYVDEFIVELTGITNEMLENAPLFEDISKDILDFIANDIIVGHNINFDINFLYDYLESIHKIEFNNDFWDLMRLSKKIIKDLYRFRLKDLAEFFGVSYNGHKAISDCEITYKLKNLLTQYIIENQIDYMNMFDKRYGGTRSNNYSLKDLKATVDNIDENNYFYGKNLCFTGKLERFSRREAAQISVNLGAKCSNGVTKSTNVLILGSFDYCNNIKDNKSTKLKKAEELILKGQDLMIMDEETFLELLELDESENNN